MPAGLIGVVATVLGLAGMAGFVLAYLNASRTKATIELYRTDNDALRGRVQTLEENKQRLEATLKEHEIKIGTQARTIAVLSDQVTGASAVAQLERTIIAQHTSVLEGLDRVVEAIGVFTDLVRQEVRDQAK